MTAAVNPWKSLAQRDKADALAGFLARALPDMTAEDAAQLDASGREAAARLAGVRPASDEAWGMVVERLRRRERRAS